MSILDFIKFRDGKNAAANPQTPVPKITKADRESAERQHDESLARKRDITGKEHSNEEGKVPEALVAEWAKRRLEERAKAPGKERPGNNQKTIKRPRPSWER